MSRDQLALGKALGVVPMTSSALWDYLAGFAGKTNQQREAYIAEILFPAAGLKDPTRQRVLYGGAWGEEYGSWDSLHNVIATRKGTLPDASRMKIVLGGHFDKVTYPGRSMAPGISDGILDNASGVALVAALAHSLPTPANDLEFIGFASEEPPPYFNGSRLFFSEPQNTQRVLFYVNFDCLGTGNLALVAGSADPGLAEIALNVAKQTKIPLEWRQPTSETNSDQLMAAAFGVRTLGFASTEYGRLNIHVPEDNLTAVDRNAYYQHYVLALRILAYIDAYFAAS